ncbi:Peptidyl-prolyl cis-trans isomerase E [Armadillidium nasatum]|uniref:Cyclophilin E n=1 Tax=Armadillidium nasatum TaxID=96803 RepID=A0A5N5TF83_9CRUS|nr:Peptidyl-prolyl cis-trans isomerase E [Armadillidium nasatum]
MLVLNSKVNMMDNVFLFIYRIKMMTSDSFKIYCGNLSSSTTGSDLEALFSKYGTVIEADHMASESDGVTVLSSLHGFVLKGEKMVVQKAINSKKPSTSSLPVKRNVAVGQGISSLDDFDSACEQHHQQQSVTSSPSHFSLPVKSSISSSSSGRPSPLLLSSASSTSYTPEHNLQHVNSNENKFNNFDDAINKDDTCGICNTMYNNTIHVPKFLSCNHTFCSDCLTSLVNGSSIKCPLFCPYVTVLQDSGVSDDLLTRMVNLQVNHKNQTSTSFEQEVCFACMTMPPGKLCTIQKHEIFKESEAFLILKNQLRNILELSFTALRDAMALQASLKERMEYTLHSVNKFAEELTFKVSSSYQSITNKYRLNYAKDTVNSALQSVLLQLKEPNLESGISRLGISYKEAFSLASTLKENADKGNFANVLLIYLLSDLLFTRYRPLLNPAHRFSPFSHSFGNVNPPSVSPLHESEFELDSDNAIIHDSNELFGINKVIETTKAIESSSLINGSAHNLQQENFNSPVASSALSLGISNISLIDSSTSDNNKNNNDDIDDNNEELETDDTPRPVSYLDAVKKPAKQSNNESQIKQAVKPVPAPMKPTKFPHCWMVLSINGITAGRILFQLRPDKAPQMCENFIGLCTHRSGYGYKGTHFFKSGDGFLVGGDVENDDGTGGYSCFDRTKFEADLCPLKDDVGMVRFKGIGTSDKGRGMVGSQFMIWYTEREFKKFSFSLVFGKVVDGLDIVQEAANHNLHKVAIKVEECGAMI